MAWRALQPALFIVILFCQGARCQSVAILHAVLRAGVLHFLWHQVIRVRMCKAKLRPFPFSAYGAALSPACCLFADIWLAHTVRTLAALLIFSYTVVADTVFSFLDCKSIGPYNRVFSSPGALAVIPLFV